MTDIVAQPIAVAADYHRSDKALARLRRRYAAERRFKWYGIAAIAVALGMLLTLLGSIVSTGYTAFVKTQIRLDVHLDPAAIDPGGSRDPARFDRGAYQELVTKALLGLFPDVTSPPDRRALRALVSPVAGTILIPMVDANPALIGQTITLWVPSSDQVDQLTKGRIDREDPEANRPIKDRQLVWYDRLVRDGLIQTHFNNTLFTGTDSNYPEVAGIWGSIVGSVYTLLITLALAFPIGVASAIYLEEFAPKNRWTDLIEVNINNLAAVPSIVFGLLGLAVFLQFFGLPRSAPLVGGMVLALMSLPTIIIAARAALKAVPPSIREAALGMGASKLQSVTHHVLPLAMPGILTGVIIAMAHALGETAPLLLIGMNAFVSGVPGDVFSPSAVLPVQIYLWADKPERGFTENTSAAIMLLLVFLILMNGLAVWLRKKFERRW